MAAGSNEDFTAFGIMADARRLQILHGAGLIAAAMRRLRLALIPPVHSHLTTAEGALRLH